VRIIHFADSHLGVENYGHIDPATGMNTRLLDTLSAFDQLVDYVLHNDIDLVLFSGDAYKNREPSQTQQRELAKRISRLSEAGVPVFILIGNHDLPNAMGRATSTEIFSTLGVKNIYVSTRPDVYSIPTRHGTVQVASLPWLRRSALLSREETRNLNFEQINERLQMALSAIVAEYAQKLDPSLPSILAAHVWVAGATLGTEKMMTIGQEHTLLLSTIANPAFDYVALGHIHKGQVLKENPPVVYSGSLDRLDFGDEGLEKGFYVLDIETAGQKAKPRTTFRFQPITARQFLTVDIILKADDANPMATVMQALTEKAAQIKDAIVRVQITVPVGLEGLLNDTELKNALKPAHAYTISRDIQREARVRLGSAKVEGLQPLDALKLWLESKKTSPERIEALLEYSKKLKDSSDSPTV
jgi:exonuclease SbcD